MNVIQTNIVTDNFNHRDSLLGHESQHFGFPIINSKWELCYEGLVLIGVTCNVPCWLSHWICLWEVGKEDHKWWSHDVAHCIVHICELHTHVSRLWSHDCKDAAMTRTLRTSHFFSTAVTLKQWLKQWMHTTCNVQMDWDCQYKSVFKKYSEGLLN